MESGKTNKQKSTYNFVVISRRRPSLAVASWPGTRRSDFSDEHTGTFRVTARRAACYRIPFPEPTAPPGRCAAVVRWPKTRGHGTGGPTDRPQPRATTPTAGPRGFSANAHNPPPPAKHAPAAYPPRVAPPPLHGHPIAFRRLPSSARPLERKNTVRGGHLNDTSRSEPGNRGLNRPFTALSSDDRI